MNKKNGFTLVELLAAIAIMAVLVIMILPNVLKTFMDSRKNVLIDEAKEIYGMATEKYTLERTEGNRISYITNDEEKVNELKLQNGSNLKYTIGLDYDGKVTTFKLCDDRYCIYETGDFTQNITTEDVIDLLDCDEECELQLNPPDPIQEGQKLTFVLNIKESDKPISNVNQLRDRIYYIGGKGWRDSDKQLSTPLTKITIPAKENYYFKNYTYTSLVGNEIEVVKCNGDLIDKREIGQNFSNANQSVNSLYANMQKKYYIIKFLGNGSTSGIMQNRIFYYGQRGYKLPANAFKRTGHTFKGWSGAGARWDDKASLPYIDDAEEKKGNAIINALKFNNSNVCSSGKDNVIEFKAIWDLTTYTVTLNSNGATTQGSGTVLATYSEKLPNIVIPEKKYTVTYNLNYAGSTDITDYQYDKFSGYYKGSNKYIDGTGTGVKEWLIEGNDTLTAKWDHQNVTLKNATRVGHTLKNWCTDSACANKIGKPGDSYTITGNTTLYAEWEKNTYTIAYEGNGGTVPSSLPKSYVFGTGVDSIGVPTRANYTFNGWSESATLSNSVNPKSISATATGNKTLYAAWCENCNTDSNVNCTVNANGNNNCTYTTSCKSGYNVVSGQNTKDAKCAAYTWTYNYTGGIQTLSIPVTGNYKITAYGAQGGRGCHHGQCNNSYIGGLGGKAEGTKYLTAGTVLYIVVGGQGANAVANSTCKGGAGGYNGGGKGGDDSNCDRADDEPGAGGGGATHVATITGTLKNIGASNLSNVIIIAGGGAGGAFYGPGGAGGGTSGTAGTQPSASESCGVGTQTSNGLFGYGGNGVANTGGGGGSGAGLYGGTGGLHDSGGCGGSSYIGNVTGGSTVAGQRSGNGMVTITFAGA